LRKIIIEGGIPLKGEIKVNGAKNAVLPQIAAALLTDGVFDIDDCPRLSDVDTMCDVLSALGVGCVFDCGRLKIDTTGLNSVEAPAEMVRKMRASFLIMGPLLARKGIAKTSLPGGCAIGSRPIDLHLKGFEALGAEISIDHEYIVARTKGLKGSNIYLDFPSVGATENIMMAASLAEGNTVIGNAAKEPEIVDLANMLGAMGAKIKGAGTDFIRITGVSQLHPTQHTVIPDRIAAASYMVLAAASRGEMIISNVITEHLTSVIAKLIETGATVEEGYDGVHVISGGDIWPVDMKTLPYPGFPTDMQAQFMAYLAVAKGTSIISETVFENRFMHVSELRKMGADIRIEGHSAIINGVSKLHGSCVRATDLRAGAAMIIAGLMADGVTVINDIQHIERGYEDICGCLKAVGAKISIVDE